MMNVNLDQECVSRAVTLHEWKFKWLLPMLQVLTSEQDLSTKRNAFLMLCQHDQNRAIQYLLGQLDSVAMWGDILQMAVLELIRKASCRLEQIHSFKLCQRTFHK